MTPTADLGAGDVSLRSACRLLLSYGYTPVETDAYRRLRAWLDETNGWPPKDWRPSPNDGSRA